MIVKNNLRGESAIEYFGKYSSKQFIVQTIKFGDKLGCVSLLSASRSLLVLIHVSIVKEAYSDEGEFGFKKCSVLLMKVLNELSIEIYV